MKNSKKIISGILSICAVLGWWGAIYPQFTLLESTYEIVYEDEETDGNAVESEIDSNTLYWRILDADCDQIRFRSRLLKELNALQEKRREIHESGSQ